MEIHRVCSSAAAGGPPPLRNSDCRLVDCAGEEEEDEEEICVREASLLHDHSNGGASSSAGSPSPSPSPQDGMDSSTECGTASQIGQHPVKQWSYEEQFRQVYNWLQLWCKLFSLSFSSTTFQTRRRGKNFLTSSLTTWQRKVQDKLSFCKTDNKIFSFLAIPLGNPPYPLSSLIPPCHIQALPSQGSLLWRNNH